MELPSAARAGRAPFSATKLLSPPGANGTSTAGRASSAICVLMMYYTTVSGWMLAYFFKFVSRVHDRHSGNV